MIKVKDEANTILAKDMKTGQIGMIMSTTTSDNDTTYNGCVVIKAFDTRLISLNSIDSWENSDILTFQIKILPNGTMLEVTDNEG